MKIIGLVFILLLMDSGAVASVTAGPTKNLVQMVSKAYTYRGALQAELVHLHYPHIDLDKIRKIIAVGNEILSYPGLTRLVGSDYVPDDGITYYINEALATDVTHADSYDIWISAKDVRMFEEDMAATFQEFTDGIGGRQFYFNIEIGAPLYRYYWVFMQNISKSLPAVDQEAKIQELISPALSIDVSLVAFNPHEPKKSLLPTDPTKTMEELDEIELMELFR